MTREWAIHAYKARLDAAIEAERWDEADRVRVATKRRLLELVSRGCDEAEMAAVRDALADSFERLRLGKRIRIDKGPQSTATMLAADAETAGIATEQSPLPQDTARDIKERILQILSSGNRRPWSTSELARETGRRVETCARAISQLRAERKITSRRIGRYVLHRIAEPQYNTISRVLQDSIKPRFQKKSSPVVGAYLSTIIPAYNEQKPAGAGSDRGASVTDQRRPSAGESYPSLRVVMREVLMGPYRDVGEVSALSKKVAPNETEQAISNKTRQKVTI